MTGSRSAEATHTSERDGVLFPIDVLTAAEAADYRARLEAALGHIDRDRLIAAPDCGLGFLGRDLAMTKLRNLCEAARSL